MNNQNLLNLCRQAWYAGSRAALQTKRQGRWLCTTTTVAVKAAASQAVPGLILLPKKVTQLNGSQLQQEAEAVLAAAGVDSAASKRRVAPIQPGQLNGELYPGIADIAGQLFDEGHVPSKPNVGQVNQYPSDGGCPMHVDARGVGAAIAMVSLGSPAVLELIHEDRYAQLVETHGGEEEAEAAAATDDELVQVLLEPLSVVILSNESRYHWLHGVREGAHTYDGVPVDRGDRTSIVLWSTDTDPNAPPFKKKTGERQAVLAKGPTKRAAFKLPGM